MCQSEKREMVCEGCILFKDRWCSMHYIEVDRDAEGCRDYIDERPCGKREIDEWVDNLKKNGLYGDH
jgi:hypothetical protein